MFSKEEGVVRTSRARLLSVHTLSSLCFDLIKVVCGPKAGARDRAPRDVRTTKNGLKSHEKMPPILVRRFCTKFTKHLLFYQRYNSCLYYLYACAIPDLG